MSWAVLTSMMLSIHLTASAIVTKSSLGQALRLGRCSWDRGA